MSEESIDHKAVIAQLQNENEYLRSQLARLYPIDAWKNSLVQSLRNSVTWLSNHTSIVALAIYFIAVMFQSIKILRSVF